jgi:hypothetical protein
MDIAFERVRQKIAWRMFPKSLRREVILLVCIKAAALILIYYALVAPMMPSQPSGVTVAKHLLSGSGI